MKTLLTLLLLLSSNIIFADEEAKISGAFGDIFDIGMTDQDTGTKTPNIDEGKDLYQVQLALAYAARDTQMIETSLLRIEKLKGSANGTHLAFAKTTTSFLAYVAVASHIYNNRKDVGNYDGIKYEDFKEYIDSVNVFDEEGFMDEYDFNMLVFRLKNSLVVKKTPKEAASEAFFYDSYLGYKRMKEFITLYVAQDELKNPEEYKAAGTIWKKLARERDAYVSWESIQREFNGDISAALMNLRQSIYNVCVSCPPI